MNSANLIFYVCANKKDYDQTEIKIGQSIYDDEFFKLNFIDRYKNRCTKLEIQSKTKYQSIDYQSTPDRILLPDELRKFLLKIKIANLESEIRSQKFDKGATQFYEIHIKSKTKLLMYNYVISQIESSIQKKLNKILKKFENLKERIDNSRDAKQPLFKDDCYLLTKNV